MNNTSQPTEKQRSDKNSHVVLLEKLNDKDFAREFFARRLERAKDGIEEILSVTLGWNVLAKNNSEWGHRILLEVFETLLIRHKNFSRSDFIEKLQKAIFDFTMTRDEAYRQWETESFAKVGLDENGVEIEADSEIVSTDETESYKLGLLLSCVLNNPLFPAKLEDDFRESLNDFTNLLPSDKNREFFNLETSPEYLARLFKIAEA